MFWQFILLLIPCCKGLAFRFTIVHNNDMHARYDPVNKEGRPCPEGDDAKGLCFGGFPRIATAVSKARAKGPALFLNTGDTFYGTAWYSIYKADLAVDLMNMLKPDAVALGIHEFYDNVTGLLPFLNRSTFPIVCCNLDISAVPELKYQRNLVSSTIIKSLGTPIGIIGYITPQTKFSTSYNLLGFYSEIPSIHAESKLLKGQGVEIIIALGHSGYETDRMIALFCPHVDVVVGGHSHTFLYTGTPPSVEKPVDDYPSVVVRHNGQKVPIVHAYAFTKYLGYINLEFDEVGELMDFEGSPILLDNSITPDAKVDAFLDLYRLKVDFVHRRNEEGRNRFLKSWLYMETRESAPSKHTDSKAQHRAKVTTLLNLMSHLVLVRLCNGVY